MITENINKKTLPVNDLSENSQILESDITIERCPHDEANRFSVISNALIRDVSISPECRWLVIYLLSNKEGWRINIQQIINHLKPHMGKNKVYALFDEAIKSGYMKKEDRYTKNKHGGRIKSGVKYFISESPKFNRLPENREAGHRDAGFQEHKNILYDKKDYTEEILVSSLKVPANQEAKASMEAKASCDEIKPSKEKLKKEKQDFPPEVREVADQIIEIFNTHEPDYSPPKNLAPFLSEVDFLLRIDKRDPQRIYDILNWALSDSFWRDKMFKPNPAKYLREKFLQLKNKMEPKPEIKRDRRFAPCSDDKKAVEIMQEMKKRAL